MKTRKLLSFRWSHVINVLSVWILSEWIVSWTYVSSFSFTIHYLASSRPIFFFSGEFDSFIFSFFCCCCFFILCQNEWSLHNWNVNDSLCWPTNMINCSGGAFSFLNSQNQIKHFHFRIRFAFYNWVYNVTKWYALVHLSFETNANSMRINAFKCISAEH